MAISWSESALATCNSDDIWDGSVPLYSPDICLDESQHRLDFLFMSKEKDQHSLPSPISDNSSPSQNSIMDISPSIDSMFFQQPGITSPDRNYMVTSQSSSANTNTGLGRPAEVCRQPTSYFDQRVAVKSERRSSFRQSKRNRNASGQARQRVSTRNGRTSQQQKSWSDDESSEEGDTMSSHGDHPHQQPSRGRGRMRSNGRLPHNQVERKYREGINSQLEALRQSLPSLRRFPSGVNSEGREEAHKNGPPLARPSKATILATATAYIKQIEAEKHRLADENRMLMYSIISPSSLP